MALALVVLDDLLDLLVVGDAILLEQVEGIGLGGRLGVRLVEQRLNSQQDLLDGDGGAPALVFVEDAETHGARRVDVGVEERRDKLACVAVSFAYWVDKLHGRWAGPTYTWAAWWGTLREAVSLGPRAGGHHPKGRGGTHTLGERHFELEIGAVPDGLLLAWDHALPLLQVQRVGLGLHGSSDEAERMVLTPPLSVALFMRSGTAKMLRKQLEGRRNCERVTPYLSSERRVCANDVMLAAVVGLGVV